MRDNLKKYWEMLYPVLISAAVGWISWWIFRGRKVPEKIYDLMANGVNIGGIAIGFLATIITLMFSLQNNYIIQQLKSLGYFKTLMSFFYTALISCFALVVIGVFGLFLNFNEDAFQDIFHIFLAGWVGLVTMAGLSVFRFVRILYIILQNEHVPNPRA